MDSSRRSSETPKEPTTSSIIARQRRREKLKRRRRAAAIFMILLIIWVAWSIKIINDRMEIPGQPAVDHQTAIGKPEAIAAAAIKEPAVEIIQKPAAQEPAARYELTAEERKAIESVVTAEAVGEPFAGQIAVAQCILTACEKDNIGPIEALKKYKYAKSRPAPTNSVTDAVAAVFDDGWYVTTDPILYFYAPNRVASSWHESQDFVIEINGHRFFAEANQEGSQNHE